MAADAGDPETGLTVARGALQVPGERAHALTILRRLVAQGDPLAAGLLVGAVPSEAERDAAAECVLVAARARGRAESDPRLVEALVAVWAHAPRHRSEVVRLIDANWTDALLLVGLQDDPAARPILDRELDRCRVESSSVSRLFQTLKSRPEAARPEDALRCQADCGNGSPLAVLAPLLGLDLRPLDPRASPALTLVARGDWAGVESAVEVTLRQDSHDVGARRAAAHAWMARARAGVPGSAPAVVDSAALVFAGRLVRSGCEAHEWEPALLFDAALVSFHEALDGNTGAHLQLLAHLDAVLALAPEAAPRVDALRAAALAALGPLPQPRVDRARRDLAQLWESRSWSLPGERGEPLRAAAEKIR